MKVSVIIPVFNGSLLIKRCLDSVFNQGEVYDLEVIVVDDGSTDNSSDIVRNYTEQVKLLQQDNLGPAAARNRGIEIATGKYIAFLDSDDYWFPDFLKETVGFLEKNHEAIAVSVGQKHKIPGKADSVSPDILISNAGKFGDALLLPDFFDFWARHNHVCTGSVLMRTEIVKQTGGQRPEFRMTEDLEFWAYLATFGQWGFIPRVLFVSDGGAVTRRKGWIEKNMMRWSSAPTAEEWESRIVTRISKPIPKEYLLARGRIAWNLAYAMLLSSRYEMARITIRNYGQFLPKTWIPQILVLLTPFSFIWSGIGRFFRLRERMRKV